MRKINNKQHKYYFSDKLKKQLAQIQYSPVTVVEAPSGFGKTTAMVEYFKKERPQAVCEWYTCLGKEPAIAWMRICDLFMSVDPAVADSLRKLDILALHELSLIPSILKNLNCNKETYLIIDNYQLIECDIHEGLINAFSTHGNSNMHMVFITQQFPSWQHLPVHNNNIYWIGTPAFFFDSEGITRLFRMEGLCATDEEIANISTSTEGWIAAIRLQMIHFEESGSFAHAEGIDKLLESTIWRRLTPLEKDFSMAVSLLDSFTFHQAVAMLPKEIPLDLIEARLKSTHFIRYLPDKRLFTIHSLLLNYLKNRFYHQTEEYKIKVYREVGIACAALGQYGLAAKFFYMVKDFDAILSLPFSHEYFYEHQYQYIPDVFENLINECPKETLFKYPSALLVLGYQAFVIGNYPMHAKICELLDFIIQNGDDRSLEELRQIRGEYIYIRTLAEAGNLSKLAASVELSQTILGDNSKLMTYNTYWRYPAPSILSMLWSEIGGLQNAMQQMDKLRSLQRGLTGGGSLGARSTLHAEALLCLGEDDLAETMCHAALYEASSSGQASICLCNELILARIAILRGDKDGYLKSVKNIQACMKDGSDLEVVRLAEWCMSVISLTLGIKDDVVPWLHDMQSIKKTLYPLVVPMGWSTHLGYLYLDEQYNKFHASCGLVEEMSECKAGNIKFIMPKLQRKILLAIAMRDNGQQATAELYLKEALDMALPDRIYLPFAEVPCMVDFIEELGMEGNDFSEIIALCRRQQKGVAAIKRAIIQDKSPLTPREREIALLAKERFSRKEIAEKLYISEATVNSALNRVYSKLEIRSRNDLNSREF